MKKVVLMLTVIAASVSFANAQGLSGGVKAGLNLANLTGDIEETSMKVGFHVGGYVNFAFSENLSLQPELLYNAVGTKFDGMEEFDGEFYESENNIKLAYISIPVNLVYSFGVVNIHAGPQFSFLASAKNEVEIPDFDVSEEVDIKDGLKGMDLGLNVGLGANFGKLSASARYTIGLSNINDEDADDFEIKNSNIQISLGYRLFGGE